MWLWRQENVRKRHLLWGKLLLLSGGVHSIFLLGIFLGFKDSMSDISLIMHKKSQEQGAPVMFMPIQCKKAEVGLVAKKPLQSDFVVQKKKLTTMVSNKSIVKKKKPVKKIIAQKKVEPKEKIKKQIVAKKTEEIEQKVVANMQQKQKKIDPKKIDPINKVVSKKNEIEKNLAEDEKTIKLFARGGYREIEVQRRMSLLQKELAKTWYPPIGVSDDCVCSIIMVVGWNGTIEKLEIVKSSGVLMYDVSARSALYSMNLPEWTKGKSVTIAFKK